MIFKKWELLRYNGYYTEFKCPCCNVGIFRFERYDHNSHGLKVNIESEGIVPLPKLWLPGAICRNPFCEWSKVKIL